MVRVSVELSWEFGENGWGDVGEVIFGVCCAVDGDGVFLKGVSFLF
jgi:hypothetical protein